MKTKSYPIGSFHQACKSIINENKNGVKEHFLDAKNFPDSNGTKCSAIADSIVEAAERIAGLVDRRNEEPPAVQKQLTEAQRFLFSVAEYLDTHV